MRIKNIIFVVCILYLIYIFSKATIGDALLNQFGICAKGVLLNKSIKVKYHKPDLVYQFVVNDELYEGNSLETDSNKVGGSICIIYLKEWPSVNRPINYLEGKNICSCVNK